MSVIVSALPTSLFAFLFSIPLLQVSMNRTNMTKGNASQAKPHKPYTQYICKHVNMLPKVPVPPASNNKHPTTAGSSETI